MNFLELVNSFMLSVFNHKWQIVKNMEIVNFLQFQKSLLTPDLAVYSPVTCLFYWFFTYFARIGNPPLLDSYTVLTPIVNSQPPDYLKARACIIGCLLWDFKDKGSHRLSKQVWKKGPQTSKRLPNPSKLISKDLKLWFLAVW